MFKNFSVGLKIVGGFIVILLLLSFVAGIGIRTVQHSSKGFDQYRTMAREANSVSEFQSYFLRLHALAKDFILSGTEEYKTAFESEYQAAISHLENTLGRATDEQRRSNLEDTRQHLESFHQTFLRVADALEQIKALREGPLKKNGPVLQSMLSIISQSDFDDDPPSVTFLSNKAFRTVLETRLAVLDYLYMQNETELAEVKKQFKNLTAQMKMLGEDINNSSRKQWFKEASDAEGIYEETVFKLVDLFAQRNELRGALDEQGKLAAEVVAKAQQEVVEAQESLGPLLQSRNSKANTTMITTSAAAAALGLVLAILISLGLIRPLRRAMEFSHRIANGDFSATLQIKGRNEIARLAQAMEQIPGTLQRMQNEFIRTVHAIQRGRFTERCNPKGFSGAYKELIDGANQISDRLLGIIDNSPVAIMAIDPDFNVLYMNKAGASAGGVEQASSLLGGKCYEHFKTNQCQSEGCVCRMAMDGDGSARAEIQAQPLDKPMHISAYAMPIKDETGKLAGSLEFIVDQTEITTIQRTMRKVADEASIIADSLSSAAEELAAQSDQISQGAEHQQARMAETATSMEEMNATVMEVARNAGEAASSGEEARDKAQSGAEVVNMAVSAISAVQSSAEQLQQSMAQLGDQAQAIGKVMGVITDIADQTNLLALNAAIEAARAGDAGRGFAVVADEVRKLAEKTMGATKEVENSIRSIQASAQENLRLTQNAGKAVGEATQLSSRAGQALDEIVTLVVNSAQQVSNIATAAEQQSASSAEISHNVEDMNRHVSETAQAMNQSAKAVQELSGMAARLNQLIAQLR